MKRTLDDLHISVTHLPLH